ncbi:MAG: RNA 2',3'-cyclic phosphodiesterase [Candidatus Muirbacterium halophilum]|nr:RNA 2',3'-cyclic phosphodiesterase [Candidatus Muirbacterium halophilum]MCK9474386.1 RNA 2',3'-cyclic phosphodiesterase [Candidatus Muirbacterium halophilum]
MDKKMRVFAAFDISNEFKIKLYNSIEDLTLKYSDINWVKPENFHITLKFYENIGDIQKVKDEIIDFSNNITKIPVKFRKFSFFSHKVFYAQLKFTPFKIVKTIKNQLNTNFTPHITLARNKFGIEIKENIVESMQNIDFNHSEILDNITIYESILKKTGSEYRIIEKIYLKNSSQKSCTFCSR